MTVDSLQKQFREPIAVEKEIGKQDRIPVNSLY